MIAVNKTIENILYDIENKETISPPPMQRKVRGKVLPNKVVKIMWDDDKVDFGYTFMMPGCGGGFWNMVVHIENPTGESAPIWCTLSRLSSFRKVIGIYVKDESSEHK
jgi:hypothetical protein